MRTPVSSLMFANKIPIDPQTCSFLSTSRAHPVHMLDAFTGMVLLSFYHVLCILTSLNRADVPTGHTIMPTKLWRHYLSLSTWVATSTFLSTCNSLQSFADLSLESIVVTKTSYGYSILPSPAGNAPSCHWKIQSIGVPFFLSFFLYLLRERPLTPFLTKTKKKKGLMSCIAFNPDGSGVYAVGK